LLPALISFHDQYSSPVVRSGHMRDLVFTPICPVAGLEIIDGGGTRGSLGQKSPSGVSE